MTQRELADALEVDPITVSRWERDAMEPTPTRLRQIAELAELPVAFFYEEAAA